MNQKIILALAIVTLILITACSNNSPTNISSCTRYYDGCNTCQVKDENHICTEMYCQDYKEPKCLE